MITVNGVTPRLVKSCDAFAYCGIGRTKFYEVAAKVGARPVRHGKFSLWRAADLDLIADFVESGNPLPPVREHPLDEAGGTPTKSCRPLHLNSAPNPGGRHE